MKLIQRANKQLRIPDERLDEYKKQGYKEVTTAVKPAEFICPVCNKPYRRESDLLKHIEKEHPDYGKSDPDNGGGDA